METITESEALRRLIDKYELNLHGSVRETAAHLGISERHMHSIKHGVSPIPDWLLMELGMKRVIITVEVK